MSSVSFRFDRLILTMLDNVRGKDIPIVHRVVRTFPEVEGRGNVKKVKEITVYGLQSPTYDLWLIASFSDTTPDTHKLLTKVCSDATLKHVSLLT